MKFNSSLHLDNVYEENSGGGYGGIGDPSSAVSGSGLSSSFISSLSTYDQILEFMTKRFEEDPIDKNRPHLVGLIIGNTTVPLVNAQIIPKLEYWHYRSDNFIDFFCVGFSRQKQFEPLEFAKTLKVIKASTRWIYSGGTDLILVNAKYFPAVKAAAFDFSTALSFTLENIIKVEGFEDLGIFFEKIIVAAEKKDDVNNVSNTFAGGLAKSALKGIISYFVPEGMRKETRDAFLFAVKNIAK